MTIEDDRFTLDSLRPVLYDISNRLGVIYFGLNRPSLVIPPLITGIDDAASHIKRLASIPDPLSTDSLLNRVSVVARAYLLDFETESIQRRLQDLFEAELQPELQKHKNDLKELCLKPTPEFHFFRPTQFLPEYTEALFRTTRTVLLSRNQIRTTPDGTRSST